MSWGKEQYCSDLATFAELIQHYDQEGYIGVGSLYSIDYYKYKPSYDLSINDIELKIETKVAGTRPIEVSSLKIYIDCSFSVDIEKDINRYDVIQDYSLDIVVVGDANGKEHTNCWHLDKDIPPQAGHSHKSTHPSYHFQAGGDRLENKEVGDLLLLGAPRLPHPPMDIFLAIHFVISNFYGKNDYPFVQRLFDDERYIEILKRAKERMFVPYFQAFKDNCLHEDFNLGKVFPIAV